MKFVFSIALPLGVALAASVAYAQGVPTSSDTSDQSSATMQQGSEGLAAESPSVSGGAAASESADPNCPPKSSATAPYGSSSESKEAVPPSERAKTETKTKTETKEQIKEETGAYMTTPTGVEEETRSYTHNPGFMISVGGGLSNYADSRTQDITSLAGTYTARLGIATRMPLALELAYVGSAQNITAVGLDPAATFISNGVEGVLRLNLMQTAFRPYIVGGAGYQSYTVANESFNTSAINEQDSVAMFPLGAGLAYSAGNFLIDGRGEYRWVSGEDFFGDASLNNWNVQLLFGAEF